MNGLELHVAAKLSPGLPRDVEERLVSGLATTVLWRVRLFAFRNLWWDGLKDERRYEVTATFRPVSGDFLVERRLDGRLLGLEGRRLEGRRARGPLGGPGAAPSSSWAPISKASGSSSACKCAYARGVALGVVPTTVETDWVRSGIFDWPPTDAR